MSTPGDRTVGALREIIKAEVPTRFFGIFEYQITDAAFDPATNQTLLTGLPLLPELALPPLEAIELRPAFPGAGARPGPGSTMLVAFINGDAAKPFVIGFDIVPSIVVSLATYASALPLPTGAEIGHFVRYGDSIELPVAGALASGPILQLTATAPNPISKVTG